MSPRARGWKSGDLETLTRQEDELGAEPEPCRRPHLGVPAEDFGVETDPVVRDKHLTLIQNVSLQSTRVAFHTKVHVSNSVETFFHIVTLDLNLKPTFNE